MHLLAIPYPNIDPVALSLGPVQIKWYGISYAIGLVLGWLYIRRLLATSALWPRGLAPFTVAKADDLLIYMAVGTIIGGRLGSVLLYEPGTYLRDPLQMLRVWEGGMAFHGALIGCGAAIWVFARRNVASVFSAMDLCAAAVPIGLFFGRLANFVNGELFGRPTNVPWAMVFPEAARIRGPGGLPLYPGEPLTRHPSQLYEAALEGLALFLLLRLLTHGHHALNAPGRVVGTFLIGYGCARSFCELFRQPDPLHALTMGGLTPGIAYSIPMVLLGLLFIRQAGQATRYATP